jgi:archaeal flagellar protein FlaH
MSDVHDFSIEDDDLCQRLGGGLPRGAIIVIEGQAGCGKSVLAQRLTHGLLENGSTVCYVSTELTTKGMLSQMDSLGYASAWAAIPGEDFVFLPTHPTIGARVPRSERLPRLLRARRLYTLDVIVFDAFSKILADHEEGHADPNAARDEVEAVLHLFKRLSGLGKTIVLTIDPDQDGDSAEPFIEAADVFLRLEKERIGNTSTRRIIVERMSRAAGRYNEVIGYRVEPGIGIVIEIRAVVG